jgi:hypothetical protein
MISHEPDSLCLLKAVMIQFSALAGAIWSCCIGLILYLQVIKQKHNLIQYQNISLIFTLFISIATAIIPLITGDYEYRNGKCDISGPGIKGKIFRFVLFYGIVFIIIIINSYVYLKIIAKVKQEMSFNNRLLEEGRTLAKRLKLYPIIMIITYITMTLVRIMETVNADSCPLWLISISFVFFLSNGLMNSVVYGLNESVKEKLMGSKRARIDNSLSQLESFTTRLYKVDE